MRRMSDTERKALELVQLADAEESHRATWWGIMAREDKARALLVSGLNKHRAADPLETFTAHERAMIYGYLSAHVSKMEVIMRLMGVSEVGAQRVERSHLH